MFSSADQTREIAGVCTLCLNAPTLGQSLCGSALDGIRVSINPFNATNLFRGTVVQYLASGQRYLVRVEENYMPADGYVPGLGTYLTVGSYVTLSNGDLQ